MYRSEPNVKSFAQAAEENVPNKNLGVILTALNRTYRAIDYTKAVGNIVSPINITHASWIGNDRFCIFLKNIKVVDSLMENRNFIKVENIDIPIRRYITPAKRVILSGVLPFIRDSEIELLLKQNQLQVVSPVSHLKVGTDDNEYAHILSFRRQVFIVPPESGDLPQTLVVQHENEHFRIFLETDNLKCFKCKNVGHIANLCQNLTIPKDISDNVPANQETIDLEHTRVKRTRVDTQNSTSGTSGIDEDTKKKAKTSKNDPKQQVVETTKKSAIPTEELLKPLEKLINENPDGYILTYNEMINLFSELTGSTNPIAVLKSYTKNLTGLSENIFTLRPFLKERSIKARFTRLHNRINRYLTHGVLKMGSVESTEEDEETSELDEGNLMEVYPSQIESSIPIREDNTEIDASFVTGEN